MYKNKNDSIPISRIDLFHLRCRFPTYKSVGAHSSNRYLKHNHYPNKHNDNHNRNRHSFQLIPCPKSYKLEIIGDWGRIGDEPRSWKAAKGMTPARGLRRSDTRETIRDFTSFGDGSVMTSAIAASAATT